MEGHIRTEYELGCFARLPESHGICSVQFGPRAVPVQLGQDHGFTEVLALENKISGGFPDTYAECFSLERLRISHNQLGNIPDGIWALPNMNMIDFIDNDFIGKISPGIGTSLILNELILSNNRFSRELPVELGKLVQLERLYLDGRPELHWLSTKGIACLHHDCSPPIIHRDIESTNILLGEDYEAKIADFGVAKIAEVSPRGSECRCFVGTHGYIAHEPTYSFKVTEKSDIYSFGVVMLELVTGRRPIEEAYGEGKYLLMLNLALHFKKHIL
ncbi:Leucine-rich receptor-like protein kinase family protein [Abeliophyllum distichum]|uniref:Leucine-rich receptor-like protein kinase family protein n=1 Tax=Abeliophyllum distichum TaxID=126358 RepID=A0ABD1VCB7_9LAMI